ncbi:MAG: NADH:ubiquinone oxidoreductase [Spirochaetaceae bacterium]|nr:MAG: NADH:ubiquinone oxidoreductase [Spirochaetaceae bacterium]
MQVDMFSRVSVVALFVLAGGFVFSQQDNGNSLLLDDFSREDGRSRVATQWEGFTDRVMGGRSDMSARIEHGAQGPALRMTGRVSLENNGGFIQMRLPLSATGAIDASGYRGVAVTARATGDHYYIHLRTSRTRFPWSHYEQKIPVTEQWKRIELPFADFVAQNMLGGGSPDVSRLRSVAVVAGKADFTADIRVRSIELYR